MQHRGILKGLSAAALVAATLFAAGSASAADKAWLDNLQPRVLKLADFSGDQNANFGKAMVKWEKAITDYTDGKITFQNYWSSSLLKATSTLQGVGDGVADIGLIIPSYYPKQLPVGTWLFGFGAALTGSTVHDVAAGGATALENGLTFRPLIDEYASHNLKLLQGTSTPAYNFLCRVPIDSLATAKGKRVRAIGAVWANTVKALDMTPVNIAWSEAYEGLQRGVFDCMDLNPNQLAVGLVLKDVAPEYVPVTTAQLQSSSWVMNLDTWNSFPKELQDFITKQDVIAASNIWKGYLDIEAQAGDLIASGKVHTNDVSELEPVADKQRAEFVANMVKTAPGSVPDPQAVIDQYKARYAYWTKALVDEGHPVVKRNPEAIIKAFSNLRDVDLTPFIEKYQKEDLPKFLNK